MINGSRSVLTEIYAGKKVWLSGHTGFKGSWLAHWLLDLGAEVCGFALPPDSDPSLFDLLRLDTRLRHETGDLANAAVIRSSVLAAKPDFLFHLGAQPLVRKSYEAPVSTYMTNVMGTVHVLDALRHLQKPCAAVFITTDKCYENREWVHSYREEDPLGGHDPYSSSKAAAEIAIASFRRSFFQEAPVRVASARAGNVIGGGDWAQDRILPDCIRSLVNRSPIPVRNKTATRPWQHVLEPLSGYLWLAAVLAQPALRPFRPELFTSAFNFAGGSESNRPVSEVVLEVLKNWPGEWQDHSDPNAVHEAKLLNLAPEKSYHLLGWRSAWNFERAIQETVGWYKTYYEANSTDAIAYTTRQIQAYTDSARQNRVAWADCSDSKQS